MASSDIIKIGFDYRASLEQFEKETNGVFDGISDKAGKQKITIQLDAKDDKVIDKIKELQKLKLDKFTFEFGNSGLKEQLQTFDKLENKINEIINLSKGVNLSFDTKNKTEAYNQLKKYADVFKDYYGNEEAMASASGTRAGYAYYKAYEEALKKGVAQSKLEKVTIDFDANDTVFSKDRIVENRIKEFENFQKYGNADESNLIAEITSLENRLLKFDSAYSQVKANLGDAPITPEITKNIEEYVRLLEVTESRAKDAEIFGYSYEDINSDKDLANMYLDFAKEDATAENKKYIESLKQEETQAAATAEAEQKLAEAQKEVVSNTSNSNDSQIEELKSDIQDVKTELGDVKDRISSIESNGFENVREDVEKTKESVKELNSELTEMKSNLSSTTQESNISSGSNLPSEVSQNNNISDSIQKKKEALASYELQLEETRYEVEKLSNAESKLPYGFNRTYNDKKTASMRDRVTDIVLGNDSSSSERSGSKKWYALGNLANIDASALKTYQMWQEELQKVGYTLSEIRDTSVGLTADIIPIDEKAITNAEEFRKTLDSITTLPSENVHLLNQQITELESKISSLKSEIASLESHSADQKKDAFSDTSTDTKPETQGMEKVEKATEEAVQAKKEFATANEGVQSSIDGSENPLKLEAELMGQIAKYAREAAEAKKEFVEANKQVKESANESNSDLKAKPKKDRYAKRRKVLEEDFLNYSPNRVNEKLLNSGYTILGETVNTELVDGLVKVSAKIKDADGAWKSFSAKVDADGNIFEQRFKTVTNGVDKLETALQNFGRETAPALTYQETLDKAQKIKNSLNLGDEYSIKVDSNEFVTITKKLTDVENVGSSVTQTFKSAQDAIDNFGKATSNSAEKTSVALKSVKSNVKEVVDETEKLANSQKEQNANVNLNGYDKRLDSYQGKINKYDTTIKRFEDGGWSSDTYLKNVQAVRDAVKQYATLLDHIKTNQNGIASDEDIQNLDKYEKKIKDTIATVTNMSASEKGYNFVSGQKELDKIHKLLNENSKMSSEAKAKIKAYYKEIESGNPSMSLDKIHGEIMKIYNAEVEAGRAGKSFFDTLKNSGFHQIAAQMAGMFGFYDVINLGKEAISTIVSLDDALVDLKKTTAMNRTQLEDFYYDANDVAKQMGVTTEEIITQASAWSRLGYSSQEAATTMAKLSSKFASISPGMSTDEAQEGLVSIMKAFDIDPDDVETEIMDKINVLGNKFAEENQDVVEGLKRSAAAMSAMGQSFTDTAALFTGGMEILQDSESMGTALRTLSMRVRGYDEETEQLSDDLVNVTGEVANLTKTAQDSQGVSLFTDATQEHYRSMVEYLGDIADRWDQISEKNQTQLLQQLFGKNRANESVCPYVQKCA